MADESLGDNWRTSALQACMVRGGAALAAASFIVQAPGPWHEDLQHILRLSGVGVDRPAYSSAEYTVGLCYVAGTKGLPAGLRHRAVDALVHRANDAGYAEARHLLPKNGWTWLADAVREGWALWTAQLFSQDESAPLTTRMRVGLALAEHEHPAGYVPTALERLAAHPGAASKDRLALAVAVGQRAPKDATGLLRCVASDSIVQAGHRMQAIELLDEIDPVKAEEMRALQTRLPSVRAARDQQRDAAARAKQREVARRDRETPAAVTGRLDSKVEELLNDLRCRGSADWLADHLDDHIAENDWNQVAQDIAEICGLVRDEEIESSIRLVEVLTQIRYGDEASSTSGSSDFETRGDLGFPRLTREELEEYARAEAERSWTLWRGLVEKHGWDDDRLYELDRQADEVDRHVADSICQKAGDHLRALQQYLVWELWPALVDAAERRDYGAAHNHLATARLLGDEAEHAEALWRSPTLGNYSFDPRTMSWPRDFWLVMEQWRRGTPDGNGQG
ncbi:hypothetical protein [Streptomyces pacificus]|uniref:hypothetical protein n=1 Tax=Streptomyces pacificus TaxID=2705029 RepID=UPI00156545CF|nr:hypothetical protein [Streptomyces pacificus]